MCRIFASQDPASYAPVARALRLSGHMTSIRIEAAYVLAQFIGAFAGVAAAHVMFGMPVFQVSAHIRPTLGEGIGEMIATFGLILVISLTARFHIEAIPVAWRHLSRARIGLRRRPHSQILL